MSKTIIRATIVIVTAAATLLLWQSIALADNPVPPFGAPPMPVQGANNGHGGTYNGTHIYYGVAESKYSLHRTRLQDCALCHRWDGVSASSWTLNLYGTDLLAALNSRGTATATATLFNDMVARINVTLGGGGYTVAPAVTIAAPPAPGVQATATATISGGIVTAITVTNPGSGYTTAPAVTISPGGAGAMNDGLIFTTDAKVIDAALGAIESSDSDGDGRSNASELWALTFAGDPNDFATDVQSLGSLGPVHGGYGDLPDQCARCHRVHTAQAPKLLSMDEWALCTSCHDGSAANTNVVDGRLDSTTFGLKGGGFTNTRMDTSLSGVRSSRSGTSTHTANGTPATMWGWGTTGSGKAAVSLRCGDCHDPHDPAWSPDGGATIFYQYRMLRLNSPTGTDGAPYSSISRLAVPDEMGTRTYVQSYDTSSKRPITTYQPNDRLGNFCAQCHTRYMSAFTTDHTSSGVTEEVPRTGDSVFTYQHATKEASCSTSSSCHVGSAFSRPRCLDCHVSHGTSAVMGSYSASVPWPGGASPGGSGQPAQGIARSSLLRLDNRGVCTSCHTM